MTKTPKRHPSTWLPPPDPAPPSSGRNIAVLTASLAITVVMLVSVGTLLVLWFIGIVALLRWTL